MTSIQKIATAAVASLTIATAFAPTAAEAGWRGRTGGLFAAGLIGGVLAGAALAGSNQGHARPVYAEPRYDEGCVRKVVGHTYDGRAVLRTICY